MSRAGPSNPEITSVRNIAPKSRDERGQTRDEVEKGRLMARTGGFQRYTDPSEVLTQPPDSLGYADDLDRFNRDTVGAEKMRRDAAYARKEMIYYARRTERSDAEEERWKQVETEYAQDEQSLAVMREDGEKARRNKPSVPYHLLSMQYAEDPEGEKLRYEDDGTKFRASHRAANLQNKDNATGFNPITGEQISAVNTLGRPRREDYGM
ncbi:hypothetical protein T492DRAFT_603148 [Pavlovales sp. CCMP2436]|nr:hypothetical protein T492DRAFT_603148 [Pavlovales sp. CCMP2436]